MYRLLLLVLLLSFSGKKENISAWIRINQLGYTPSGIKVAVWCSKASVSIKTFQLVDAKTKKFVYSDSAGKVFGSYGPFKQTYRLNFSSFKKPGRYYLQAGGVKSPEFTIGNDVYKGSADFCLRYMRQQRSGFNPFLKDSCHTHDGYTLYGETAGIPDSTYINVTGGWHDASDYLQYVTTSANATWHLLASYRDFPNVFSDEKQANGLDGKNDLPDVLDEAKWGLDWLLKMNPSRTIMFNQLGDDRDHMGMRIPKEDSFYGRGYERPVYFVSGEPQQRGKFMNNTTGVSSTAAKYASVFAMAHYLYQNDSLFKRHARMNGYYDKTMDAYQYAGRKPGVSQTASVRSPYIYAEENWTDDMELAAASIHTILSDKKGTGAHGFYISAAVSYAKKEKITPWLGDDTAKHYQWYPFINLGHYELAKQLKTKKNGPAREAGYYADYVKNFWKNTDTIIGYYREGIERVWRKARQNAFYRGVPFIWCSNNLTASFAIQCYWYRQLTGDKTFSELEQANLDWLFGCNPWGTSMVYGLPSWGDTPVDPHSAFTHLKNYPIDGGLIDGPVYGSIYKNLIGITLYQPDEYAEFQSDLAVYHDDYGDYSTNEPTMDGTASLIYLLAAKENETSPKPSPKERAYGQSLKSKFSYSHGGIVRGDSTRKEIALVFTGHEFFDGGDFIAQVLKQEKVKASFFLTGDFYYNAKTEQLINKLRKDGHFLGNHSGHHLLYCDWNNRDSLLVSQSEFDEDLFGPLERLGHLAEDPNDPNKPGRGFTRYFLPPYEWYNDTIAAWTKLRNIQLINYTPGTLSTADYTTPEMKNYRTTETIYKSIIEFEKTKPSGLNGFILLLHIGTDPKRTDKFYKRLPGLVQYLKAKGYRFQTIDQLLKEN
ncbi:MAG: glycoside hydrolase family 9 protein [Chitinophagales bacterium]